MQWWRPRSRDRQRRLGSVRFSCLHWLLPLFFAGFFYISLSHEAARRILALETVENYGFAVFNQLLWNFSHSGHFQQTIHRGYTDSWMWSGHKAALLPLVGYLYSIRPGPLWLAQIQIGAVALGAFPAYALGRLTIKGILGGLVGLAMYFAYPALYYMALSDYQDIVLAIPALLLVLYTSRRGSKAGFVLSALLACAAREELALIVALIGFGVPGPWSRKLRFGLMGVAVSAVWLGSVYALFRGQMHYESSAQTQLFAILSHLPALPPILYDKAEAARFYLGFLRPVQWLALGSPLTLIPGAGALGFHMLVNPGNGVDRIWSAQAHIHHLAPVIPLFVGAALETLGWLCATIRTRFRSGSPISSAVLVILIGVAILFTLPTWKALGLRPHISLGANPYPVHPVWILVRDIPKDAVAATDMFASLAISSRHKAYTYDESLEEKVRSADPLAALDYLLVNQKDSDWMARAASRPGAVEVDKKGGYTLFKLR